MKNNTDKFFKEIFTVENENIKFQVELMSYPNLVSVYQKIQDQFVTKLEAVYYPCGNVDISPSVAFPDSHVIYAETEESVVKKLKEEGYDAHLADANTFNPGPVDLLIMINPTISPEGPAFFVKKGGVVVCNNYHSTADHLHSNDDFDIVGVIKMGDSVEQFVYTENLNLCWQEVNSEEEFKLAPFSFGVDNYDSVCNVVRDRFGDTSDLIKKYKDIIKEEQQELGDEDGGLYSFNISRGAPIILTGRLPRKIGTVDDIFVFSKNN